MPNLSFSITAASSFTFCRPAVEYRALPEDFKYQLSRCAGGNLTWHEGQSRKTAGGRTVKLLQQPGTEGLQVRPRRKSLTNVSVHLNVSFFTFFKDFRSRCHHSWVSFYSGKRERNIHTLQTQTFYNTISMTFQKTNNIKIMEVRTEKYFSI